MKVYIRRSGGVANITLEGVVDTKDLPAELRMKAEGLMRVEKLKVICAAKPRKLPDTYQYEIHVAEEDEFEAFTLDESAMEGEVLEVLSGMIAELRRKQTSRRGERGRKGP